MSSQLYLVRDSDNDFFILLITIVGNKGDSNGHNDTYN